MVKFPDNDRLKSSLVATAGSLIRPQKSPDEGLGELFSDVQNKKVYSDGKVFADLVPRRRMRQIQQEYLLEKQDPDFDLRDFVNRHFYAFGDSETAYKTDPHMTLSEHISGLWKVLEKRNRLDRGSLIALPYSYVVPGGRFKEQFYWDSYFIMLGLAEEGKWDIVEGMMKNYAYMFRKFGFIPTANRTYFLSRSQPPFFSHMVRLLARHKGKQVLVEYLPYMLQEYRFWMKGHNKIAKREHKAYARVVEMPNGILLNRYYDNKSTPRPESLHEDTETAKNAIERDKDRLFLHLRAGAESGWDFSSRWFRDPEDISTIHTADIVPVDLNCLIYELEQTIAQAYQIIKQPLLMRSFLSAAQRRRSAILKYCWNDEKQFFFDYNFHIASQTPHFTLAGVFPLFTKLATSSQARKVAGTVQRNFVKKGGLVTSLTDNGQQWDSPNGWAPLHYITIHGLRSYGYHKLANEIKGRWVKTNVRVYKKTGKLMEKYNVVDISQPGGGGEYPLQDGFGWTNGVLASLLGEDTIPSSRK